MKPATAQRPPFCGPRIPSWLAVKLWWFADILRDAGNAIENWMANRYHGIRRTPMAWGATFAQVIQAADDLNAELTARVETEMALREQIERLERELQVMDNDFRGDQSWDELRDAISASEERIPDHLKSFMKLLEDYYAKYSDQDLEILLAVRMRIRRRDQGEPYFLELVHGRVVVGFVRPMVVNQDYRLLGNIEKQIGGLAFRTLFRHLGKLVEQNPIMEKP